MSSEALASSSRQPNSQSRRNGAWPCVTSALGDHQTQPPRPPLQLFHAEFLGVAVKHKPFTRDQLNLQHGSASLQVWTAGRRQRAPCLLSNVLHTREIISASHHFGAQPCQVLGSLPGHNQIQCGNQAPGFDLDQCIAEKCLRDFLCDRRARHVAAHADCLASKSRR